MFNIIKKFLNKNILEIFRYLKIKTGINFYPDQFRNGILIKIIYTALFLRVAFQKFKKGYQFLKKSKGDKETKIIFGLPRSGNHFLHRLLGSYLEQLYSKGDGTIKIIDDKIKFNVRLNTYFSIQDIINATMKDQLLLDKNLFSGTHFPSLMTQAYGNLHDLKTIKKIILLRNPKKVISSLIIKIFKDDLHKTNDIVINKAINRYYFKTKDFFSFWHSHLQKINSQDFLIIKYEELVKNTEDELYKILKFSNIEINRDYLIKSIERNKKENVNKTIENINPSLINSADLSINNKEQRFILEKKIEDILYLDKFNFFGYKYIN